MSAGTENVAQAPRHVLFFDGECVLCNRSVHLVLKLDRHARLRFAALQGATGRDLLGEMTPAQRMEGVVLYTEGATVQGWRAIAKVGGVLYPWLRWTYRVLSLPPLPWLLGSIYAWVGRNRYRWFGQYDACVLPPPEFRDRYLVD